MPVGRTVRCVLFLYKKRTDPSEPVLSFYIAVTLKIKRNFPRCAVPCDISEGGKVIDIDYRRAADDEKSALYRTEKVPRTKQDKRQVPRRNKRFFEKREYADEKSGQYYSASVKGTLIAQRDGKYKSRSNIVYAFGSRYGFRFHNASPHR